MSENLQHYANLASIIGIPIAAFGLFFAVMQIRQSNKIASGQFMLELKRISNLYDSVHLNLRPGGDWYPSKKPPEDHKVWAKIDDYMGFFEYCEMLMQDGSLDPENFADLFSYRIQNILRNEHIVDEKLKKEASSWVVFRKLVCRLKKMKRIDA